MRSLPFHLIMPTGELDYFLESNYNCSPLIDRNYITQNYIICNQILQNNNMNFSYPLSSLQFLQADWREHTFRDGVPFGLRSGADGGGRRSWTHASQ